MGGGRLRRPPLIKYVLYIQKIQKIQKYNEIKWLAQKYNKNQMTHYICWGLEDLRPIWRLRTTCSNDGAPDLTIGSSDQPAIGNHDCIAIACDL